MLKRDNVKTWHAPRTLVELKTVDDLSPRALRFLELMADLTNTESTRDRAKAAGLSESYGYRLSRRPEFIAALRDRVRETLRLNLARVYARLVALALAGDVSAARLLMQAAGDLDERTNIDLTLNHGFGVMVVAAEQTADEWAGG